MDIKKIGWKLWSGFSDSGWRPVVGSCEHDNEPSGSVKGG